jgi:hypothetical protein
VLVMNESRELPAEFEERTRQRDLSHQPWFREALAGHVALLDHHVSDLVPPRDHATGSLPEAYHIGIAGPVRDILEPTLIVGVVYVLVNWSHFQKDVIKPPRPSLKGDASGGHLRLVLRLDVEGGLRHDHRAPRHLALPEERHARHGAAATDASCAGERRGDVPRLQVPRRQKGAFKHCRDREHGGLGWVVGVGIDDEDTFERVQKLRRVLILATVLVLGTVLI